ncbi:hypothetical protein BGZ81_001816 [Podila clonocystis]|nr:hypothetical protein BGZ81_001816 [Podila clonocystis]
MLSRYLTIVTAAALVSFAAEARLLITLYKQPDYLGTPHSVPFPEAMCTRLPSLPIRSIRIPEDYDCFFYVNDACSGDPDVDAFDSIPDVKDYTPAVLHSFKCEVAE